MNEQASRQLLSGEQRAVRDAYGVALVLVLGSVLGLIASGSVLRSLFALISSLLLVAALFLTLRVSGVSRRTAKVGEALSVLLFAAAAAGLLIADSPGQIPALIAWTLLTAGTIAAIGRRLRTYERVTLQLVMGLMVIYLLIGILFGLAYELMDSVNPPAFAQGAQNLSGALYYSFITLATVGYGDVSPGSDVVRALAVAESLIGQLYLVSVVSLAVSRLGIRKRQPQE